MSVCVCTTCSRNCVPSPVKQGEKVEWGWTLCDYPADEYELQFRFRGPGVGFDVDATADGDAYDLEHTFAANLATGKWAYQAWVTEIADPTNSFEIQSGTITVDRGFAAGSTAVEDLRTAAEQALAAIDAALLAFATSDVVEYEIETPAGRRRVKRSDKTNLLEMRKLWAGIVAMEKTRERLRNGGALMRSVPIVVRGS